MMMLALQGLPFQHCTQPNNFKDDCQTENTLPHRAFRIS